jgi:hypothetical protein
MSVSPKRIKKILDYVETNCKGKDSLVRCYKMIKHLTKDKEEFNEIIGVFKRKWLP